MEYAFRGIAKSFVWPGPAIKGGPYPLHSSDSSLESSLFITSIFLCLSDSYIVKSLFPNTPSRLPFYSSVPSAFPFSRRRLLVFLRALAEQVLLLGARFQYDTYKDLKANLDKAIKSAGFLTTT